jgi:hypothetical protein
MWRTLEKLATLSSRNEVRHIRSFMRAQKDVSLKAFYSSAFDSYFLYYVPTGVLKHLKTGCMECLAAVQINANVLQ